MKNFITIVIVLVTTQLAVAQRSDASMSHLVSQDGRWELMVDGSPFLILGAQCNNSSAWPATLPKVWPAMDCLHANTLEIPIYWEQLEPKQGKFDFANVDTIIAGARKHNLRLVLLWFGTWKNGSNHYLPQWMKLQPKKYFNMKGPDGKQVDSPSPFAKETLKADIRAFTALMSHLKQVDSQQHTVIMVQVENEPGTWQCRRDHSDIAQKAVDGSVPKAALEAMKKPASSNLSWSQAFGKDADVYFHAWNVASYIDKVAAAAKAVYPLPMYVNAAVRNPVTLPDHYEYGGATDNVLALYRAAAPAIDILSPDIYEGSQQAYQKLLDSYARPDNPLFIPETIGFGPLSRMCFAAIGKGAIGYAPFGMDFTRTIRSPDGMPGSPEKMFEATARNYRILAPMAREIAKLNFEGMIHTVVEDQGDTASATHPNKVVHLGNWNAEVYFGSFSRVRPVKRPKGTQNAGRVLIGVLSNNRFLITGEYARITFKPVGANAGKAWQYLAVEEGTFDKGVFKPHRILNGDQTDWGLSFTSQPKVLRVSLYTR